MTRSEDDLKRVPENELGLLPVEELLRVIVMGRESKDANDKRRARSAIRALLAIDFDRVKGIVVTFRFPGHEEVRISPEDTDDAIQDSFERIIAMLENFRGETIGQYRAALRTTVFHALMDFCRRKMHREKRIAGHLEDPANEDDPDAGGRFDRVIAEMERIVEEHRRAALDELTLIAGAVEKIKNENMREVLRLTWAKCSSKEIAEQLGVSVANVDQLRSRGIRELKRHLEDDDGDS